MKVLALLFTIFIFVQAKGQIPLSHLVAWYAADTGVVSSGGEVSQWSDISGNGFHLVQSNPINRPEIEDNSLVHNKVIRFSGSSFLEVDFGQTFSQPYSIFAIYNSVASSTQFVFDWGSPRTAVYLSGGKVRMFAGVDLDLFKSYPFGFFVNTLLFNSNNSKNIENSNNIVTGNTSTNGLGGLRVGSTYDNALFFYGSIAEVIIYDTIFSSSTQLGVETYLMNKYAPPISLGPDTTIAHGFCPYKIKAGSGYTSYLWSTGSNADSIVVNETGDYWVQVTDIFGRTSRDTIHVQYPYTALPDSGLCLTDTIAMNTGLDHAYSFLWIDGSTDSLLNVWEPGEYWVQITDSTAAHCSVLDSFVVVADSFPVQASLGPDVSMCAGNEIALVSGIEPGIEYAWSTGDTTETVTVFANGTYWVEAVNENGCTMRDSIDVYIHGVKPTVAFASSTPCLGNASAFTDLSYAAAPDGVAAWSWNFAGQGTSAQQNPQFEFGAAGDYNVELVVTTDSGCFGDTTLPVHVRSLPQAHFSPVNGCNGQSISFRDETAEAEGSLFSWNWNFGDGHTDNGQNPLYTYADTGIYTVTLISSDMYGCSDTAEREVIIRLTPVVDFTYEEDCLGLPTTFAETTDMPGWAGIISRTWYFGDGMTAASKTPSHIYAMSGNYNVTLVNRSINGCVDSTTKVVLVYPYPVAGFTSGVACEGNEVCFVDTSYVENGVIAQWNWNFGNSDSDTVSAPCTVYADTGFYQVQLEVSSDFGCSSIVSKSIEVHPVPHSDFSLIPEYGIPPLDVQFYNYTQGAIQYNWSFGDGAYSSALNPQHVYNSESIYNIILVSENMFGCTDTASANVYVIPSVLDLVLMNLQVTDSAGYLNLKAQFFNNGTRNIRKVALDARVGNNIPIREEWNGFLEPGQYGQYHFTASFLKPDISNVRLVCMDISTLDSYGQRDTEPENNASCHSLVEDFFIASVFPSPAADYVYADISVPDDGDVELSLVSRDGRELIREVIEDTEAGTLRIKMDLRFLADGMYILHAAFADKTDMYRFVKTTE